MAARKYPPATCVRCFRRIKLTPRLTLYRHTYASRVCEGSGQGGILHCTWCDAPVWGEDYMIHDHLWEQAFGEDAQGLACVNCVESRLGRELERIDFTDAPINVLGMNGWPRTVQLVDRLLRTEAWAKLPPCGESGPDGLTCTRREHDADQGHQHYAVTETEVVLWYPSSPGYVSRYPLVDVTVI